VSSMSQLAGQDLLQLGIAVNPGNSGGPVFDDQGRVIGVLRSKARREEGIAFCIPVSDLRACLAIAEKPPERATGESIAGARGNAKELKYGWKAGRSYVYAVEIEIDTGPVIVNLEGTSTYRAKSEDADGVTFRHQSWMVTRRWTDAGGLAPNGISGPTVSP